MHRVLLIRISSPDRTLPGKGGPSSAGKPSTADNRRGFGFFGPVAVAVLLAATAFSSAVLAEDAVERADNFIVRGTSAPRAAAIVGHAERLRSEAFERLLDEDSPPRWTVRCVIHVHASVDSFIDSVGGAPEAARGATSLQFAGDRVVSRRIDVMGDGPDIVPDALAHELVHVVLADHFVHAAPPRWADEGLALLFDAPEKQREHESDFRDAMRRGLAWPAAELLTLEDYPADSPRQRVFYGQSAALVRWLIARRTAATFIRFVDDSHAIGVGPSLRRHYDLDSAAALHLAWKETAPIHSLSLVERSR